MLSINPQHDFMLKSNLSIVFSTARNSSLARSASDTIDYSHANGNNSLITAQKTLKLVIPQIPNKVYQEFYKSGCLTLAHYSRFTFCTHPPFQMLLSFCKKTLTLNSFPTSIATIIASNGVDALEIQALGRWRDIDTMKGYVPVTVKS